MIRIFKETEDFKANHAAEQWCSENGYSVGIMQGNLPRGIKNGNFSIAKWSNLDNFEKRQLDGVMTGNFRNGPITIKINILCDQCDFDDASECGMDKSPLRQCL